jgi:hypothetical protein
MTTSLLLVLATIPILVVAGLPLLSIEAGIAVVLAAALGQLPRLRRR